MRAGCISLSKATYMPKAESIWAADRNVQKSPSSKAAAFFARGAYFQYVSTRKRRERRWRIFSTFPTKKTNLIWRVPTTEVGPNSKGGQKTISSVLFGRQFTANAHHLQTNSTSKLPLFRHPRHSSSEVHHPPSVIPAVTGRNLSPRHPRHP